MKRLAQTQHKIHCPLSNEVATLTVRSDLDALPSRRHRRVTACSLLPPMPFVLPARKAYFADVEPPVGYLVDASGGPHVSTEPRCPKRCLHILNAAECGTATPLRCLSGGDSLELVRQTQGPGMMRAIWYHSGL